MDSSSTCQRLASSSMTQCVTNYILAWTQVASMPVSFTSLTLASVNIFYSLRLGRFSEPNPSIKMILFIFPLQVLLLSGPLFSLILVSTYFQGYVFLFVAIIIGLNFSVMKFFYFRKRHWPKITEIFVHISTKIYYDQEALTQSSNFTFLTSVFTSWISPCTVWYNNFQMKSYFLIVLSCCTLASHSLAISSIYSFVHFDVGVDEVGRLERPIFNCFRPENVSVDLSKFHILSTNDSLLTFCSDCPPSLRFCRENEEPGNRSIKLFAITDKAVIRQ